MNRLALVPPGYPPRGGIKPEERPRRPPKFNSAMQRMCHEPACAWPAERVKGDQHLCTHHFKLRHGYLGKLVEERDARAAEMDKLNGRRAVEHYLGELV